MKRSKHDPALAEVGLKPPRTAAAADTAAGAARGEASKGDETMALTLNVMHAARALLKGTISESSLGPDVMYAVRGFRAGLMDKAGFLEAVAHGCRQAGAAFKFDANGNLKRA